MRTGATTPTGGRGSRATGVVAGFVLKLSRQTAGLTQEKPAELLGVDATTVQGWESGRRPLAAVGAGELVKLSARLTRAGAPASTGRHLNDQRNWVNSSPKCPDGVRPYRTRYCTRTSACASSTT
jgi:hypothetical protein